MYQKSPQLIKTPRIVPDRDNYRRWYLDEDFTCVLTNGDVLVIRKGFRFDAHSVPWPFRWLFPRYDTDIVAALVHDYLIDTEPWHRYNRKFMDDEYTALMQKLSSGIRRYWMPKAVRVYGWLFFDLWGDYRGDPNKYITKVEVVITQK